MTDLQRCLAFLRREAQRVAARSERFEQGIALFRDELPRSYSSNFLLVDRGSGSDAAALAAVADRLQGPAGLLHRKVDVHDPTAADLAAGFRRFGWSVGELVVMAHRGPVPRPPANTAILTTAEARGLWEDELRDEAREEDVLQQLIAARALHAGRHVAALADGRPAASCDLYSDSSTGQIENVSARLAFRRRGLGTAIVTRALAESAALGHDLTFLIADAYDWPRTWYRQLGFEEIGSIFSFLRTPQPLADVRVRTPRLELRLATRAELQKLAEVARGGIHPPELMPFSHPWMDNAAAPTFADDFVAYHHTLLAQWTPERWVLDLVAFLDARPVGNQELRGERFAETRTVSTGSWLGQAWQNRGLGTEMRAGVLELAFRSLGAETAASGAFADNPQSARVSAKLGYREAGTRTEAPRGETRAMRDFVLRRREWRSPVQVELEGVEPALPLFGVYARS